jgi:hypothetical protein
MLLVNICYCIQVSCQENQGNFIKRISGSVWIERTENIGIAGITRTKERWMRKTEA